MKMEPDASNTSMTRMCAWDRECDISIRHSECFEQVHSDHTLTESHLVIVVPREMQGLSRWHSEVRSLHAGCKLG